MSLASLIFTVLSALMAGVSAFTDLTYVKWVVQTMADYGVPRSWLPWLGTAKAAGAVGLFVGLFVPVIGLMAGIGIVLYFTGAVLTVVHAHRYSHIPFPLLYMAPVIVALVLRHTS
jgi:hypothetical protein